MEINQLTKLNLSATGIIKLKQLYLNDNFLTSLPKQMEQLHDLKILDLSGNLLSVENMKLLKKQLPRTKIVLNYSEYASYYFNNGRYWSAYYFQKWGVEQSLIDYTQWYDLSLYSLFINRPEESIHAAKKTKELKSEAYSIETNLALAYLLNNQYGKSEDICSNWKGKIFSDTKQLSNEVFLQKINALESAGITHPHFTKVKALFNN